MQLPLLVAGIFFLIGTGIMAGAVHVAMLVVGRVLLGFGVGIASLVVPMLNAELSPPKVGSFACAAWHRHVHSLPGGANPYC